jgi:hypothetical protein
MYFMDHMDRCSGRSREVLCRRFGCFRSLGWQGASKFGEGGKLRDQAGFAKVFKGKLRLNPYLDRHALDTELKSQAL